MVMLRIQMTDQLVFSSSTVENEFSPRRKNKFTGVRVSHATSSYILPDIAASKKPEVSSCYLRG
jgi:hypothetical protein